jgi:hypothetical protein
MLIIRWLASNPNVQSSSNRPITIRKDHNIYSGDCVVNTRLILIFTIVLFCCGEQVSFRDTGSRSSELEQLSSETPETSESKFTKPYLRSPLEDQKKFITTNETVLPKGTKLVGIFRYDELQSRDSTEHNWVTAQIILPKNPQLEVLGNEFISYIILKEERTVKMLEETIESDQAIVALDMDKQIKSTTTDSKISTTSKASSAITYDEATKKYFTELASEGDKVIVGIIDTGLDFESPEFKDSVTDLRLTNILRNNSNPIDIQGHGTQIASIIASKTYGLAAQHVELLPLLVTDTTSTNIETLGAAIIAGTNLGAEVLNISLSGETHGCTPLIGHLIFRAIEKGVFFSFSAGNGIAHAPEVKVGYPITAAYDDGPLNFQRTQMPACWGKYFLGAITSAAVDPKQNPLAIAEFSNYGEDIELGAPGVGIPVFDHKRNESLISGTSSAAAYVSAAAALAIYHHKLKGYKYSPWYIEDLLVESAKKHHHIANSERRTRFGSVLNLEGLASILKTSETLTPMERLSIPTVNPRYGEGWLPGRESNLDKLSVTLNTVPLKDGPNKFQSYALYNHNKVETNVSANKNQYWYISHLSEKNIKQYGPAREFGNFSSDGTLTIDLEKIRSLATPEEKSLPLTVVAIYDEHQHQLFEYLPISIPLLDLELDITEIKISHQKSLFRLGQTSNWFKATANNSDGQTIDVTGSATWTSSVDEEFRPTNSPGIFDALNARLGTSYTVSARYQGVGSTKTITVEDEKFKTFIIHSALGNGGNIVKGQVIPLYTNYVFDSREEAARSDWFLDGKLIAENKSKISIDTAEPGKGLLTTVDLADGDHLVTTKSMIRLKATDYEVSAEHKFTIWPKIERVEIHLKDPIVREDSEIKLDVRAYYNNNSYKVVTEDALWKSSDTKIMKILSNGKAIVAAGTAKNKVTVTATFLGKSHSKNIVVVKGSTVTGSESELVDIEVTNLINQFECRSFTRDHIITGIYKDGTRRDITSVTTVGMDFVSKANGLLTDPEVGEIYAGDTLEMHFAYNDGSIGAGGGGAKTITKKIVLPEIEGNRGATLSDTSLTRNSATNEVTPRLHVLWDSGPLIQWNIPEAIKNYLLPVFAMSMPKCAYNVSLNLESPQSEYGSQAFILEWDHNGSGSKQHYKRVLPFNIERYDPPVVKPIPDDIPIKLVNNMLTEATDSHYSVSNSSGIRSLHTGQMGITFESGLNFDGEFPPSPLYDKFFNNDHVTIEEKIGSSFLEKTVDTGVYAMLGLSNKARYVWRACVDPGQSREFRVKESLTNTSTKVTVDNPVSGNAFTTRGSELDYSSLPKAIPTNPSDTNPSNKSSPYCTTAKNALTPYAGGSGTLSQPYLICTTTQLNHLRTNGTDQYARLMNHIDFNNDKIPLPSGSVKLDGNNYEIRNFIILDAEADDVGLFANGVFKDLVVRGATVKGRDRVGTVCARCRLLVRVKVIDGNVIGDSMVGGIAGKIESSNFNPTSTNFSFLVDLTNDRTHVSSYKGTAGGIAGWARGDAVRIASSGDVSHIGVPGNGPFYGGLFGWYRGSLVNSKSTGNIIASGIGVGGIAGTIDGGSILYTENHGSVVNQGADVGGIVGLYQGAYRTILNNKQYNQELVLASEQYSVVRDNLFVPYDTNDKFPFFNAGIYEAKNFGNVWGGMNRKYLYCVEGIDEVLGRFGDIDCAGDTVKEIGGTSNVGGIVGRITSISVNRNFPRFADIVNSQVDGNTRGVTHVGGLVGHFEEQRSYYQIFDIGLRENLINGLVSGSQSEGATGKVIGYIKTSRECWRWSEFESAAKYWLTDTSYPDNSPDLVDWEIGKFDYRGYSGGEDGPKIRVKILD